MNHAKLFLLILFLAALSAVAQTKPQTREYHCQATIPAFGHEGLTRLYVLASPSSAVVLIDNSINDDPPQPLWTGHLKSTDSPGFWVSNALPRWDANAVELRLPDTAGRDFSLVLTTPVMSNTRLSRTEIDGTCFAIKVK
jgi:hypothetical protein